MAIYVDPARHPFGRMVMCHMMADRTRKSHPHTPKGSNMAIPKTIEQLTAPETGYWLSPDEERYYGGPIDSREAALAQARTDGYAYIARCTKSHIRLALEFNVGDWLMAAEEANEDLQDEDGETILDFDQDKVDDLQATVRAAIDAWQVKHQLQPSPWRFKTIEAVEAVAKCATGGAE